MTIMSNGRLTFVWDYDIDEAAFRAILAGGAPIGRLDRDWAATRLLDYASYEQIREFLSIRALVRDWPTWRVRVRSVTRRRGLDFLVEWVTRHRPDLV
ncbi:MAG: hypothetical protein MUE61_06640 [Vicinamibacterales bacterium]|jgi:hypothetical protein|nr:hypothetical protein [Vicinamibacterales bacterium]